MTKTINETDFASLSIWTEWDFFDKFADHQITITLETTIFNGTAYIKTVMPIRLEVNAP